MVGIGDQRPSPNKACGKKDAMATVEEGGYDYDFVERPPEGLLCKICQLPCREAQSSEDHVYCKHCISETKPGSTESSPSVSYSCNEVR